jgi:hypothetical protein
MHGMYPHPPTHATTHNTHHHIASKDDDDDLNDVLMGFGGGQGPPAVKLSSVAKMQHCLVQIGQFIAGAAEHEEMLEAQTCSAREVAKKCMLGLTVAESAAAAALTKVETLNKESELLQRRAADADATLAISEQLELKAVTTDAECARLQRRCAELSKVDTLVKEHRTTIQMQASELELLQNKVNGMEEAALSAAASFESQVVEQVHVAKEKEMVQWSSKCSALEDEIKSIEPSYQQAIAQQKGRIRLLERELSASEQRQKALSDAQLAEMQFELSSTNAKMNELKQQAEEVATFRSMLDTAHSKCAVFEAKLMTAESVAKALHAKVDAMESELVDVIQLRQTSDQTYRALCNHFVTQAKRATATIATLLTTLGMPSQSKCIAARGTAAKVSYGKTSGDRELPKVMKVLNSVGGVATNELQVGDVIVGIDGNLVHELPYDDITAQLACWGEYDMNLIVTDEGSIQMIEDDDATEESTNNGVGDDARMQPALAILLSMDTVQEGMHVAVEITLIGPRSSFFDLAKDCNGQTGLVVGMNSELGTCHVDFQDTGSNFWLPVGCLVLVDVDRALWEQWLNMQKPRETESLNEGSNIMTVDDSILTTGSLAPPSIVAEVAEDQKRILEKIKSAEAIVQLDTEFMARVAKATASANA